jgi:hypothetical protein
MSIMYTDHPSVFLPAYVLAALDYEQQHAVELHLRTCHLCQIEVQSLRQWLLHTDNNTPRPAVRARLFERINRSPSEYVE